MTRKECLEQAMECVLQNRQDQYGEPEDSFGTIAMMWSAYLGKTIQGWDVAAMMALLKIARIKSNPAHDDNWCDLAGYAACGAECRQKFEAEMKKTVEDAFETFPHLKPEAESGCFQNGNDQQEFKPGDKVQVYYPSIEEWRDATYVSFCQMSRDCWRHEVEFASGGRRYVPREQIRPTPKAEGCEELADPFRDAPQTPEETCQRIVDSNPATFHAPSYAEEQLEHHSRLQAHKPTGEELAEKAEEAKIMWETRYEDNDHA